MASAILRFALGIFAMPLDPQDHIPAKRHRLRSIETYEVFVEDFNRIELEATNVGTDLVFATFWFPIGITLTVVLATTAVPNLKLFTGFLVALLMSYGFGVYFLYRWWCQRGRLQKLLNGIRASQLGPVGQEGKEIKPADLAELPPVEPSGQRPPQPESTTG